MNIENLWKEKFNLNINYIELIGKGYDSVAHLVNNCYVFKIKYSSNKKKGYQKEKAKEYQDVVEQYYPIETILYGIKNNKSDFIEKGRKEIYIRTHKNEKLRKWKSDKK